MATRAPRAVALGVSAFLLLWDLDRHSFWIDELATAEAIEGSMADVIAWCARDIHPPLYYIGVKLWSSVAGAGDIALRLFSAVAALLSVALVGPAARRWIGDSAVLPATLLLGLHPALVEFGRVARYYSLTVLLGLLSTLSLHRAVERGRVRDWALYTLATTAAVYTFYPTAALIVAHVPFACRTHALRRRFALAVVAVVLLCLPWVAHVAPDQLAKVSASQGIEVSRSFLGLALSLGAFAYTFAVGQMLYPWNPAAVCGGVAIGVLLWTGLFRNQHRTRWPLLAALMLSVSLVALLVTFVAAGTPFLNAPVRGLFALPFAVGLLAHGWDRLRSPAAMIAAVVLLAFSWGTAHGNYYAAREYLNPVHYTPAKRAARLVMANSEPGDVVVSERDIGLARYLPPSGASLSLAHTTDVAVADELAHSHGDVWLVTLGRDRTRHRNTPAAARVREALATSHERVEVVRFLPVDPRYLAVKEALLGRRAYRYRLVVERYSPRR